MTGQNWDRRAFIEALGTVTAGALVAPPALGAAPQAEVPAAVVGPRPPVPAWCDQPMRWAQLVLVENDPGQVDIAFWLDYFRRVHADAACLSAGGIVAYYPTDVPFHHRSAWLGASDPFGELVRGTASTAGGTSAPRPASTCRARPTPRIRCAAPSSPGARHG